MCEKRERMPRAHAKHVDTVQPRARRRAGPSAAQQAHLVSLRRQPAEDLVQMNLRASGQRMVAFLQIHEQNPHYIRPMRRASASSTPFTNFALFTVPYRSARRTDSWITTRGGVSA